MKARALGITALLTSVLALACSIIAYHVLEEPRPVTQTRVSVQFGGFRLERQAKSAPDEPDLKTFVTPYRLRLCAIGIAILGILLSALSWIRREGFGLGFGACTIAAAALAWIQFVVVFALLLLSGGIFVLLPLRPKTPDEARVLD
jgi:hypothetical protein